MVKKATSRKAYRGTVYRFVTVDDTVIGIRVMLLNPDSIVELATNVADIEPNWIPTKYKLGDFDSIESCVAQLVRDGSIPQLKEVSM